MELRIQTLGGLRVFRNGEEYLRLAEQPTRAAVLVYLAIERDVTRDVVQGVIWGRLPPDRARHSLNQTLYLLRKDLGEDWILSEGERLCVSERLSVDAHDFETAVAEGAPEDALLLYHGDFLEGWYLRDTPEFEQWTDVVRLRLSSLHREACRSRLSELRSSGRTEEALDLATEWVRRAPREDEGHHQLIELLARSGRRAEALEHFEAYEKSLAAEALSPLDATRDLVESIRNGENEPIAGGGDPGPYGPAERSDFGEDPDTQEVAAVTARSRTRAGRYVAAIVVLVAAGLLALAAQSDRSPQPTGDPKRVLVFPLENRTGDATLDPMGTLAGDWITRSLARASFLEVFPSSELIAVAGATGPEDGTAEEFLARAQAAAREAGCGTLVTGAYYSHENEVELHVQVLQSPDWKVLESVGPIRADPADPMEAVDVLGQRVLIGLALFRDQSLAGVFAKSERPPSYAAYVAFVEGFRQFLAGQYVESAAAFMRANEISPEFTAPLIPAAVGLVYGSGDFRAADSVLRIAEASADRLPNYDRLRLELVRATLWGDHRRAHRAAKEAAALLPGGTANYAAADLSVATNRPREALETLASFDLTLRPGVRSYLRYWDTETQSLHLLREHERELQEAREGRGLFPGRIAPLWYEIRALAALGRISEVHPLLDESFGVRAEPGLDPGLIMIQAAEELQVHGFSEEAYEVVSRFQAWYEGLDPQRKLQPDVRLKLGRADYLAGRLDEAREVFSELRAAAPGNPVPLRYLGAIAARTGDPETALARSQELAELENEYLFGQNTLGRAAIASRLGDREEALALLRRSTAEGVRFGTDLHADPDLSVLRDYPPYQEFMRPEG